jgi:hypothetical protein
MNPTGTGIRKRPSALSFIKKVYHGEEPLASNYKQSNGWVPVDAEDHPYQTPRANATPTPSRGSWKDMLSELDTKCEIDHEQFQFYKLLGTGRCEKTWRATLWDLDVVVKRVKIPNENLQSKALSPELQEEITLLK